MLLVNRGGVPPARLLAAIVVVLVAVAISATTSSAPPVAPLPRSGPPNVVMIVTDDQRWDSLTAMPDLQALLADHGVTFENAFATTPYCCPSRASILTGLYSRHHGVLDDRPPNGGAIAFDDSVTLATWLHDSGYSTALVGKYLNGSWRLGDTYIPPGWDDWHAIASMRQSKYYGYRLNENGHITSHGFHPAEYSTTILGGLATRFVQRTPGPFFLYFAPVAPHEPALIPPEARKPQMETPRPASFDEEDLSDKPWSSQAPRIETRLRSYLDALRGRMTQSLSAVDDALVRIVRAVEERGGLDHTVFIFTSDNGFLLGEHRLKGKVWPYEESIRVPLVVRAPGLSSGIVDQHLVLNIDLAPTVAELAGIEPPSAIDGDSLVPLLKGDPVGWRRDFVVEYLGDELIEGGPAPYEGIRTTRWVYVEYRTGGRELYDLVNDPWELDNLVGGQTYRPVERRLSARLEALLGA